MHGVVLALFAGECWFVSVILKLPTMTGRGGVLPAFTRMCMAVGPILLGALAILATAYCVWVWSRKTETRSTWVGFLSTTMAGLGFVMLPTLVAIYLPLVDVLNRMASR